MDSTTVRLTLFEQSKDVLVIYYFYCILGILAFLANCMVIVIYVFSRELRQRYFLYFGLAIADAVNGLGFIFTGVDRLQQMFALGDTYDYPHLIQRQCAIQIGNIFQVIGSQWPAFITFALGIERYIAVTYPLQYRNFKNKLINGFLMTTFIVSIISVGVALIYGLILEPNIKVIFLCSLSNAYGYIYSTYNYFVTMICHVIGFVSNIVAYGIVRKNAQKAGSYHRTMKQEYIRIKILFLISILSLIMVVLPNLFLYCARFITINYNILGWFYCLFVLRSAFNIWVIGFALKEFKITFVQMFLTCSTTQQQIASVENIKPDATISSKMNKQMETQSKMATIMISARFS